MPRLRHPDASGQVMAAKIFNKPRIVPDQRQQADMGTPAAHRDWTQWEWTQCKPSLVCQALCLVPRLLALPCSQPRLLALPCSQLSSSLEFTVHAFAAEADLGYLEPVQEEASSLETWQSPPLTPSRPSSVASIVYRIARSVPHLLVSFLRLACHTSPASRQFCHMYGLTFVGT